MNHDYTGSPNRDHRREHGRRRSHPASRRLRGSHRAGRQRAAPGIRLHPLSKAYLQGTTSVDEVLLHPAGYWSEHDVDLRVGISATRLDPSQRMVEFSDGGRPPYDKLPIATGSRNRRLAIPGIDQRGVLDLRTIADADSIRHHAEPVRRAVVAGLGFIGCETAASLRSLGLEVTAVEPQSAPLRHVLGDVVGQAVAAWHRTQGVEPAARSVARCGGGPQHARLRGRVRRGPVVLVRPVRPDHALRGLDARLG